MYVRMNGIRIAGIFEGYIFKMANYFFEFL